MSRISTVEQLARSLAKGLPPITWVSGDEALLVGEAADSVRHRARALGFTERSIVEVGRPFRHVAADRAGAVDVAVRGAQAGRRQARRASRPRNCGESLQRSAAAVGDDCRLLVTGARLERATVNTAWFNSLAPLVLLLELPKVERERLPQWLAERLSRQGQRASPPVLALIAERTEGNLLAAHQELQRLALLLPPGDLDPAQVERHRAGFGSLRNLRPRRRRARRRDRALPAHGRRPAGPGCRHAAAGLGAGRLPAHDS